MNEQFNRLDKNDNSIIINTIRNVIPGIPYRSTDGLLAGATFIMRNISMESCIRCII